MPEKIRTIFISSTCFDLKDMRAELHHFLTEKNFVVKCSELPLSEFELIKKDAGTIEICLQNIEKSDLRILILDRSYGSRTADAKYGNKSGLHVEADRIVDDLHSKDIPALFFVRKSSYSFLTTILEAPKPNESEALKNQRALQEVFQNLKTRNGHNDTWFDQFESSIDLKQIILKRIEEKYPLSFTSEAGHPDRFVRMIATCRLTAEMLELNLENVGSGIALNIKGFTSACDQIMHSPELTLIKEGESKPLPIRSTDRSQPLSLPDNTKVVLNNYNRFNDHYKFESILKVSPSPTLRNYKYYYEVKIGTASQWVPIAGSE